MSAYWTLVRRELSSLFCSWNGYVVIASALLAQGISFAVILDEVNGISYPTPITQVFYRTWLFWIVLLLTTPVITMRSFAGEKSSGTFETLMTAPVSDLQVVIAKFTGALVCYTLMWLVLLPTVFIVARYASESQIVDPWNFALLALGIVLVGGLFTSLGCLASAITRSQVIAAIVTFVLGFVLVSVSGKFQQRVPRGSLLDSLVDHINLGEHMSDFAGGVADSRAIVFMVSLTFLFLFLTLKVVESRRWK